ncbi:hypothetical protein MUK42_19700 [Musa troglodytarum]|uniref:RNase III domain-containing protein n=1 Tax=Musa troglodytarum TaxID=320322 RepID=A0A9E7G000_9LILI|nr:hypothetical protein MUK42_19700 [Musa troglodytarum]
MLASQLRKEIGYNDILIPCSLILEAMTTLRCCENFSLERLELLGDSVLKYAVSCHLFLKYPKKHEGQLSDCRVIYEIVHLILDVGLLLDRFRSALSLESVA